MPFACYKIKLVLNMKADKNSSSLKLLITHLCEQQWYDASIHDLVKQKGLTNLFLLFRHTKFQTLIAYFVTKRMHDMYNNTAHPLNSTTPRTPALIFSLYRVHA